MTITDRLQGLNSQLAVKAPVVVATTTDIILNGEQTIDGVAVTDGMRVLVKDQTNATENGIYVANTGDWQRSKDFNGLFDAKQGTLVVVARGDISAGILYQVTTESFSIGEGGITFTATADTVVGANIAEVIIIANAIGSVITNASNIDNINDIADDINGADTIGTVATNVGSVNLVGSNITDVITVGDNMLDINEVATNIPDINDVADNLTDINTVANNVVDVNNFASRYRIGDTDPIDSLVEGDLFFNTTDNALKYYDGTTWTSIMSGLTDIVQDITPQLGGDLDLNTHTITGGTLITGQPSADPELNDQFLFSDTSDDTGALKKSTLQKIYDKVIATLFGGTTVTPTGTELLALDDGTNVTAQSIADLASGGGLTFNYQDFQATTVVNSFTTLYTSINVADGKILQARYNTDTFFSILTVAEDGTVTQGAEVSISKAVARYSECTPLILLQEGKVLFQYKDGSTNWNIALLTVDTTANTVVVENTYTIATNTASGYSTLKTQSARLSSTTAMLISGTSDTDTLSNTVGRIVTLATPTTLTIGSAQNIETSTARNGQYCSALVQEPFSGDWVIMGYNTDLKALCGISFTVLGSTITPKNISTTEGVFAGVNALEGLFALPDKNISFIFGFYNNSPTIVESADVIELQRYRLNIFKPNYFKDASSWSQNKLVRREDCIINNITTGYIEYNISQIDDDNYLLIPKLNSQQCSCILINRTLNTATPIKLDSKNNYTTTQTSYINNVTKVRDGQFLLTVMQSSTNYINYQPILIG